MTLRVAAPVPPDFHMCSQVYGAHLIANECRAVASQLPGGSTPVSFALNTEGHPVSFPISLEYGKSCPQARHQSIEVNLCSGDCHISVEVAGPARPPSITVAPNAIRAMAYWLIEQCVQEGSGLGGFATIGFAHLVDYVIEHQMDPELGGHFRKTFCSRQKSSLPELR